MTAKAKKTAAATAATRAPSREELVELLSTHNPRAPRAEVEIYVGAFLEYLEAARNIAEHGVIVFHPRTGSPVDNPYLKIRTGAEKTLLACRALRTTAPLWDAAELRR